MTTLGVIVARASSKRLPRKNLLPLGGLPLVGWMSRAAAAASLDRLIVSTEDDDIASVCEANGVAAPFRRPEELASDYASSCDIMLHALRTMETADATTYDVIVLLQPTTPFVLPEHIDACIAQLADPTVASAFTGRVALDPPRWMFTKDDSGCAQPLLGNWIRGNDEHTQCLETIYRPNGAAYAVRPDAMRSAGHVICDPCRLVVMEAKRSVDIDDALDLIYAETVAEHMGFKPVNT